MDIRQLKRKTVVSSASADNVTLTENVANVRTKIFELLVKQGQIVELVNQTDTRNGVKTGLAAVIDLHTATSEISRGSRLFIAVEGPSAEFETFVRRFPYAPYFDLSTSDMRSEDFKGRLAEALDLNTRGIRLREGAKLQLFLESPDVVKWDSSYVEFPINEENL
jgi:hypothetical protein